MVGGRPKSVGRPGCQLPASQRGNEDSYPATANMAIRRTALDSRPFGVKRTTISILPTGYLGGREDAEWWLAARRSGWRVDGRAGDGGPATVFRMSVLRFPPFGDVRWPTEPRTARTGLSSRDCLNEGLAQPVPSRSQALGFLDQTVGECGTPDLGHPPTTGPHRRPEGHAFWTRSGLRLQWLSRPPNPSAGNVMGTATRMLRPQFSLSEKPDRVLAVAPTYLGDTVLLRIALDAFMGSFPETRVTVVTPYAEVFAGASNRLRIAGPVALESVAKARDLRDEHAVVITPYYHRGNPLAWRRGACAKFSHIRPRCGVSTRERSAIGGAPNCQRLRRS